MTVKSKLSWEKHGDIHVLVHNGWKRAFIFSEPGGQMYFCWAVYRGMFDEYGKLKRTVAGDCKRFYAS